MAHLNSASTPWGEKNLTVGLDLVPLQSPKWTNGFTLARASWNFIMVRSFIRHPIWIQETSLMILLHIYALWVWKTGFWRIQILFSSTYHQFNQLLRKNSQLFKDENNIKTSSRPHFKYKVQALHLKVSWERVVNLVLYYTKCYILKLEKC